MTLKPLPSLLASGLFAALFVLPLATHAKAYKIGVTAGPHAQTMEAVKKVAATKGLDLEIVEFSDYVQPNAALAAGDLDGNSYQHLPYLEAQIKDRGYDLTSVAYTITFPMGVYSQKVDNLDQLKTGARVGIPNDPTNGGRALLLLQSQGIIKLADNAGLKATPLDIVENPKKLKIVELDAAQLPRSLSDLDAAAVNGNYAQSAGMNPVADSIAIESPQGPYANILVVRTQDKDADWVKTLIESYHTPEVKAFVEDTFKESVIVAW